MTDYVDREHEAPAIKEARQAAASHDIQTMPPDIGRWRAAVLIALLPYDDPEVVLTVRSHEVEHHKGEISFPGGALDSIDEHPMAAALRRKGIDVLVHDIDPDAVAAGALRSGTQSVLNESGRET